MSKETEMTTLYAKQLDDCWNLHCHEGTFNLFGHEINVFTEEPQYNTDKNGDPDYDSEPITCGGRKCAFVDSEYWTGWYDQELMSDLKEVMTNIAKYIFERHYVTFTIKGTISEDMLDNFTAAKIKERLQVAIPYKLSCNDYVPVEDTLKLTVKKKEGSFTATFKGEFYSCKAFFLYNSKNLYDENFDGNISCENEEVKQFFDEAFNYTISF